jgi:hypothetical protein
VDRGPHKPPTLTRIHDSTIGVPAAGSHPLIQSWIAVPTNHRSSPGSMTRRSGRSPVAAVRSSSRGSRSPQTTDPRLDPRLDDRGGRRWQRSGQPVVDRGVRPRRRHWRATPTPRAPPTPPHSKGHPPTPACPYQGGRRGQLEGISGLVPDVWVKRWARTGRGGLGHEIACLGPPRPVPGHQRCTDPRTASPPEPTGPASAHPPSPTSPTSPTSPSTQGRQAPTHQAGEPHFRGGPLRWRVSAGACRVPTHKLRG